MKLYYAQYSRAVRVAWLLEELELLYEIETFSVGDQALRDPEFKSIHPLGRVPVLIDGDVKLYESGAIIQYILAKYSAGRLQVESTNSNFHQYLQWFHFAEGMIMPPLNTLVVETVVITICPSLAHEIMSFIGMVATNTPTPVHWAIKADVPKKVLFSPKKSMVSPAEFKSPA